MRIKIYNPDDRTKNQLDLMRQWYKENYAPETLDNPKQHDDFIRDLLVDYIQESGYTAPIFINPGKIYLDLFWDAPCLMVQDAWFYTTKKGSNEPMVVKFSGYFDMENRGKEDPFVTEFTKTFNNPF